ncbi:hypothetical protein PRIPAC_91912 [Pristionchus pacificus]|uniref:BZIP domain-containing protein n=1 Tax=Pristionchus pacificus TaxID=54126 RepID=A0A2A6BAJ0_PRIPA|nr:hypothetical protein PRIPAC_91912 [Pristionchus pacificus]|eukprot:PDM62861.1 hypothetical protein PRIPAC_50076 [Pristionchus pacificus]
MEHVMLTNPAYFDPQAPFYPIPGGFPPGFPGGPMPFFPPTPTSSNMQFPDTTVKSGSEFGDTPPSSGSSSNTRKRNFKSPEDEKRFRVSHRILHSTALLIFLSNKSSLYIIDCLIYLVDQYRMKRARNNEAAKKSRKSRKEKETGLMEENNLLKQELTNLRAHYEQQLMLKDHEINRLQGQLASYSIPFQSNQENVDPLGMGDAKSTVFQAFSNSMNLNSR